MPAEKINNSESTAILKDFQLNLNLTLRNLTFIQVDMSQPPVTQLSISQCSMATNMLPWFARGYCPRSQGKHTTAFLFSSAMAHGGNYAFVYQNSCVAQAPKPAGALCSQEQGLFDCSRAEAVKETEVHDKCKCRVSPLPDRRLTRPTCCWDLHTCCRSAHADAALLSLFPQQQLSTTFLRSKPWSGRQQTQRGLLAADTVFPFVPAPRLDSSFICNRSEMSRTAARKLRHRLKEILRDINFIFLLFFFTPPPLRTQLRYTREVCAVENLDRNIKWTLT